MAGQGKVCCTDELGDYCTPLPAGRAGSAALMSWGTIVCHFLPAPPMASLLPPVQVFLSGSVSSQFLTALLMAAPLSTSKEGIEIIIKVSTQRCRMLGGGS